jgi:hypothetical protein
MGFRVIDSAPHMVQPALARYELKWPSIVRFSAQRRLNTRVFPTDTHPRSPAHTPLPFHYIWCCLYVSVAHMCQPELASYELEWPSIVRVSAKRRLNTRVISKDTSKPADTRKDPLIIPSYRIPCHWVWASQMQAEVGEICLKWPSLLRFWTQRRHKSTVFPTDTPIRSDTQSDLFNIPPYGFPRYWVWNWQGPDGIGEILAEMIIYSTIFG